MPRRELGARDGASTQIEVQNRVVDRIRAQRSVAIQQPPGIFRIPEPLQFERQMRKVRRRIQPPQIRLEFHAVDDADGRPQTDVLDAQIAVPLDHAATACGEVVADQAQDAPRGAGRPLDLPLVEA